MRRVRRKNGIIPIVLLIVLLIVIIKGIGMAYEYSDNTSESKQQVQIVIDKGASLNNIAEKLKSAEVIKSEFVFVSKVKKLGMVNELKFGTFNLDTGMCITDIIEALSKPGVQQNSVKVTVPEGYSAEKTAKLLEEKGVCSGSDFLSAINKTDYDYDFIKYIPDNKNIKYKLQGFLFPNTYILDKGMPAHDIVNMMLCEFEKQYKSAEANETGYSFFETLTVASLVEREAQLPAERKTIAGVIYNRLSKGMLLQIDATVIYAMSDGMYDVDRVLYKDLETNSPYNTYKIIGLPAGPICNPGIESIRAALSPEKHNYLYYHTDEKKKDGSHIFTTNAEEHVATMN